MQIPPVNPSNLSPAHSNCKLPGSDSLAPNNLYGWAMYVYGGEGIYTWGQFWIFRHPNLPKLWLAVTQEDMGKPVLTGTSRANVEKQISLLIAYRQGTL